MCILGREWYKGKGYKESEVRFIIFFRKIIVFYVVDFYLFFIDENLVIGLFLL